MIRRLLLWDIDGTLVRAGEVGSGVFDLAIEEALGRRPTGRIRMSGMTDPQIVREYLELMGIDETEDTVPEVLAHLERFLAASADEIAETGAACEGAAAVLERLAGHPEVVSSVLTGNIAPNALVKLAAFGLDRWLDLPSGAYGSDHADRTQLVPIALARTAERHGTHLAPEDVWVIGDTPRDLACARAGGARCLLVGTGRFSTAELAPLGADAVLDDLTDTDGVVKLLAGDVSS